MNKTYYFFLIHSRNIHHIFQYFQAKNLESYTIEFLNIELEKVLTIFQKVLYILTKLKEKEHLYEKNNIVVYV